MMIEHTYPSQEGVYLTNPEGEFYYLGHPFEDFDWYTERGVVTWYSTIYLPFNYCGDMFVVADHNRPVLLKGIIIDEIDPPLLKHIEFIVRGTCDSYIIMDNNG